ncbi:hypothetical protein JCM16161A_12630 [Vulcanisaeta sp. JCM 16161]|uniref:hypothetical protein n=1 Tax=Vulcanisaeta sp. JCM 16161 TaxID=1295372 RepID=UPI001FB4F6E0|nr:hypothetical protein [Vulcanisaeta sp. JCM 16161]
MSTLIMTAKISTRIAMVSVINGGINSYVLMSTTMLIGMISIKMGVIKPILLKQIFTSTELA